ncbi:cellular retinoic acid-binding protein 1-like [Lytechinus variegatus]|uniref:cellular retinoic acid-binding protein 1-like n=1 Tax=Lytechinus variegatus TaxID=7654 RepID=UPI001BB14A30|nr:cellular retinoic acid-binding protein 1-like [Lytechinus variegatus]
MVLDLSGKWRSEKVENMDEFLKAAGVGLVIRKLMWMFTPEMEITQDGEDFVVTTKMPMITDRVEFKIGEEFTHKLPPDFKDDHTLISTWEGDKLVTKILSQEDGVTTTRTLVGEKLVMTQSKGDVTATRTFYKMEKKD